MDILIIVFLLVILVTALVGFNVMMNALNRIIELEGGKYNE